MLMVDTGTRYGLFAPDGSALPFTAPRDWFALIVRPNREMDTADWLRGCRLAAYWPNYLVNEATGRGVPSSRSVRRPRRRAVIPGYIFLGAHAGSPEPFAVAHDAPGVLGWLRTFAGEPLRVSETDIERIRNIEAGQNVPPKSWAEHVFTPGERVRITDDTLCKWKDGTVRRVDVDGRIGVDVPGLLGRVTFVHFHPHQLEPLQAAQASRKKKAR